MRPTRVQARDFRSYDDLDLQLPDGPTAIVGGNGAGKSSLLTMIELGLFAGRGELAGCIRNGADSVEVTVEVDHAGERYRVRRGAGKKSYLDFERLDQGPHDYAPGWEPLTLAEQKDTQALIDATLGLDRDTYTASAHLGQGRGSFAGAGTTPRQRMALFSGLLGLGIYEQLADAARIERRALDADLAAVRARLADAGEQLAGKAALERQASVLAEMVTEATAAHTAAQATLEGLIERVREAQAQTAAVATARETLRAAEGEHRRLADVTTAAEVAREALGPLEAQEQQLRLILEALPEAEALETRLRVECEAHARLFSEYEARGAASARAAGQKADLERMAREANEEKERMRRKAASLNVGTDCPTCGHAMENAELQRAVDSLLFDAGVHAAAAIDLGAKADAIEVVYPGDPPAGEPPRAALEAASAKVRAGSQARVELAALRERINTLRQKIAQAEDDSYLGALGDAWKACNAADWSYGSALNAAPSPDVVEKIKQDGLAARAQVNIGQQLVDNAREKHTRATRDLEHLTALAERTAADREQQTVLEAQADVLAAAEQAFGRGGIPALVLENKVGGIEATVTSTLANFGGSRVAGARCEIRTQREKKTGGLADTLEIVLITADRYDREFDHWSGGEKMRIDVALRWALAAGTGVEIVVLDEPANLDAEGKAALREIIDWLLTQGVKTVLLVSHEGELQETFEQVIRLEIDGTATRVVAA